MYMYVIIELSRDSFNEAFPLTLQIMPIVVYFCAVINILYYLGVMQFIVRHFGRFLSFCLNTTPAESVNAAANIFVSMVIYQTIYTYYKSRPSYNFLVQEQMHD